MTLKPIDVARLAAIGAAMSSLDQSLLTAITSLSPMVTSQILEVRRAYQIEHDALSAGVDTYFQEHKHG